MLRHRQARARVVAFAFLGLLAGCGVKGPLVPAPNAKSAALPPPQPIPPATAPGNPEPHKP